MSHYAQHDHTDAASLDSRGSERDLSTPPTAPRLTAETELVTPPVSMLLELFLESREEGCNAASLASYRYTLTAFVSWLGEQPLTADVIRAYLASQRERGLADSTVDNTFRQIKTFCRWAVDEDLLDRDPFSGKRRVKRPERKRVYRRVYSDAQIVQLLTATGKVWWKANRKTTRQQWTPGGPLEREALQGRGLVLLLTDSALRAGEVCSLTCGAIRNPEPVVTGKGGHTLPFFVSDPTRTVLLALAGDRADDAPLFRDWRGGACDPKQLLIALRRLARRAEVPLPPRPLHAFRHWAARYWKASGLSDLVIMDLMRHTSIQTTLIYTGGPNVRNLTYQHANVSPIARLLIQAGLLDTIEEDAE
jgi:integrase/recombinase XerC